MPKAVLPLYLNVVFAFFPFFFFPLTPQLQVFLCHLNVSRSFDSTYVQGQRELSVQPRLTPENF